jgi:hypothetical protein
VLITLQSEDLAELCVIMQRGGVAVLDMSVLRLEPNYLKGYFELHINPERLVDVDWKEVHRLNKEEKI